MINSIDFDPKLNNSTISQKYQNFIVLDNRLYYKGIKDKVLLVPTEVERKTIIKELHHLCGHSGVTKTIDKIK